MINKALLLKELQGLWKLMLIIATVLTLYIAMIISMYDPSLIDTLNQFRETMPELMAIVGMDGATDSLIQFMISYLYGFLLAIFPMIFSFFCAYKLIKKYIDKGSLAVLLAAPVSRTTVAVTEILAALIGLTALMLYVTLLELFCATIQFPNEMILSDLLKINFGLFSLHLLIFAIASLCAVSGVGLGTGIPITAFVLTMLANAGEKTRLFSFLSFFTLYNPTGLINSEKAAYVGTLILLIGGCVLLGLSIMIFKKRDFTL